ncbi:MAG TPA: tetratricopeptide repeat protein [bacterium]|nr:tetratricopeptide repeat protein [bacterium]
MANHGSPAEKPKAGPDAAAGIPGPRPWTFALAAGLATFLFYLPTLTYDFVNLDDPQVVLNNPLIHDLSPSGLGRMFTTFHAADWMPLTWLSLALNDLAAGHQPWIYHLTNDLLHAANSVLVFLAVRALLRSSRRTQDPSPASRSAEEDWTAFLSSILFGLHPLHVESVAWVTERKDVLYGLFFLATILAYLRYGTRADHPLRRYVLCLVFFLCSALSKTAAVALPVLLLGLDLWPLRRFPRVGWKRPLLEKIPFFLAALGVGMLSILSHDQGSAGLPWLRALLKPLFALFFYLWKAIVPFGLSPLYPSPALTPVYIGGTCLLGLLLLGACWAAFRSRRERPELLAALLFYLVTMAPNLASLLQSGHEGIAAADHYTYLPLLGLFVPLSAWAVGKLAPRTRPILALAMIGGLGSLTLSQASLWKDGASLWTGAAKSYPDSALIRLELGNIALNQGRLEEARSDFEFVQARRPNLPTAYRGLAVVDMREGRFAEAVPNLQKALSLNGHDPQVWIYLWKALTETDRHVEALEGIKAAVQQDPDSALLWEMVGSSYGSLGRYADAVPAFQRALQLDPDDPDYLLNLGEAYLDSGKETEAERTFEESLRKFPGSETVPCRVGEAYLGVKMGKKALGALEAAWEIKHNSRIAAGLAQAYRLLGQRKKAVEYDRLSKELDSAQGDPGSSK